MALGIYFKLFEVIFPVFFIIGIGYWFGKKTRMIVHQVLHKKGKWEYKLTNYKLIK